MGRGQRQQRRQERRRRHGSRSHWRSAARRAAVVYPCCVKTGFIARCNLGPSHFAWCRTTLHAFAHLNACRLPGFAHSNTSLCQNVTCFSPHWAVCQLRWRRPQAAQSPFFLLQLVWRLCEYTCSCCPCHPAGGRHRCGTTPVHPTCSPAPAPLPAPSCLVRAPCVCTPAAVAAPCRWHACTKERSAHAEALCAFAATRVPRRACPVPSRRQPAQGPHVSLMPASTLYNVFCK